MHIPDGYLSPSTCAVLYGTAIPFWYVAFARVKRLLNTRLVPLLAVVSAFCFVIMMFNVPLPGGTTGHAVGIGAATVVLGPWAVHAFGFDCVADPGGLLWRRRNHYAGRELFQYGDCRFAGRASCLSGGAGRSAITSSRRVLAAGLAGTQRLMSRRFLRRASWESSLCFSRMRAALLYTLRTRSTSRFQR